MPSTTGVFSFKHALAKWPRGEPKTTADLAASTGMSAYRASALARSGWLEHLARGVYQLPGDTLSREACIALLARQMPGLHVGGKTALDWRGIRHNVAVRDIVTLWGDRPGRLPTWFTDRFPSRYRATPLFDKALPEAAGLQPLPNGRPDVLVSVPERALLEMLSDAGKGQTLQEARQIAEGLPNLRPQLLDTLLRHTTRVKVIRLAHAFATSAGHPWAGIAEAHARRLGDRGWVGVTKSGERIDLRRI